MESKIRVEFDLDTNEPIIEITRASHQSDDMRDQMLAAFIDRANSPGSVIKLTYFSHNIDNKKSQLRVVTEKPTVL